jgi:hypothetical protein
MDALWCLCFQLFTLKYKEEKKTAMMLQKLTIEDTGQDRPWTGSQYLSTCTIMSSGPCPGGARWSNSTDPLSLKSSTGRLVVVRTAVGVDQSNSTDHLSLKSSTGDCFLFFENHLLPPSQYKGRSTVQTLYREERRFRWYSGSHPMRQYTGNPSIVSLPATTE